MKLTNKRWEVWASKEGSRTSPNMIARGKVGGDDEAEREALIRIATVLGYDKFELHLVSDVDMTKEPFGGTG